MQGSVHFMKQALPRGPHLDPGVGGCQHLIPSMVFPQARTPYPLENLINVLKHSWLS